MNEVPTPLAPHVNSSYFENDPLVETSMSCDELTAHIVRTRNKSFYLYAAQVVRFKEQEPDVFNTGFQGIGISSNVRVSKPALIQYLNNAFLGNTRERCAIRVWECSSCIFIGSST